jgi:predicted SAM-dependent methyltransferase
MGAPPPRSRLRLKAAAANAAYVLALVFLVQIAVSSLRERQLLSGSGASAPPQTLSDAEIEEVCQRYAVPEPPPYRPDKAALAAEVVQQLTTGGGIYNFVHNKTFTDQITILTLSERERIALEASTVVYHTYDEAVDQLKLEAEAVLKAAPHSDLTVLNGVNVGVGGRQIHPSLIGIDVHRGRPEDAGDAVPESQRTANNTLLAWADQLPFKSNTLDYIVSLHNLEHLQDPVAAVLHYLDMLKPGGGLGVAVPNWRYTWDARTDATQWGHRWNSAPEVVCRLHLKYWSHVADLEQLNTLKYRMSYDFVLRKKGKWEPFSQEFPSYLTGRALYCQHKFIGPLNQEPPKGDEAIPCPPS